MFLTCSAYVNLGSNVNPRTFGCFTVGIRVLLMLKCNCVLYSAGSGVKSVDVDLSALRVRLFSIVQCNHHHHHHHFRLQRPLFLAPHGLDGFPE